VERAREEWERLVCLLPEASLSGLSIVNQEENSGNGLCLLSFLLWLPYNRALEEHYISSRRNVVSLTGCVGCALALCGTQLTALLLQYHTNIQTNYSLSPEKKKGHQVFLIMEFARFYLKLYLKF
jgi:hypothetical protein